MVTTFDKADVIIPNADLISNQVTNWTLSNRSARLIIPVGVEYGSDVELVMERLTAAAAENPKIADSPPPRVLFAEFGDSALKFELWVYVTDADYRMAVKSELNQAIVREFKEAGITIAFPQLDLHVRSADEGALPAGQKMED
jgi:small-conductance mechanosensitive channel